MAGARGGGQGAIQPTGGLFYPQQCFLRLLLEQKYQGRRQLLLGPEASVAIQLVPLF
jgi:hypothetical protein